MKTSGKQAAEIYAARKRSDPTLQDITVLEQKNHDLRTKNALWKESFDRINSAHDSAVQRIEKLERKLEKADIDLYSAIRAKDSALQRIAELEARLDAVVGSVYDGCDSGCADEVRKALGGEDAVA